MQRPLNREVVRDPAIMQANPCSVGHARPSRRARLSFLPAFLTLIVALPAQEGAAAPDTQNQGAVTLTRDELSQWVETRRILSKEKQDWRLGRETLLTRIDVVKREIESLGERIEKAKKDIADADEKRQKLVDENADRTAVAKLLEERIAGIEDRVRKVLPRLPSPLRERLQPLTQRLPDPSKKDSEVALSLSTRYGNAIGVLDGISKWNREIILQTEVRDMPDGSSVEVVVVYVGLGQAYYAGKNDKNGVATVGGVGTATADAWIWKEANDLAPKIQQAISIYKNEQLAALVRLPVQIL